MPNPPADPVGADAHMRRGDNLRELRRYREALASYAEALAVDPESAAPWAGIGLAECSLGNLPRADEALAQAVRRAPNEARYRAWHSLVASDQGRWREGLSRAQVAIRIDPSLPLAHAAASHAWLVGGQAFRADEAARAALALDPNYAIALRLLATALWQRGRRKEHEKVARQLLELDPENSDHLEQAGWAALAGGDARTATNFMTGALGRNPQSAEKRRSVVEALKSRSPVYRFFWCCQLLNHRRGVLAWTILVGGFVTMIIVNLLSGTEKPLVTAVSGLLPLGILIGAILLVGEGLLRWAVAFQLALSTEASPYLSKREKGGPLTGCVHILGGMVWLGVVAVAIWARDRGIWTPPDRLILILSWVLAALVPAVSFWCLARSALRRLGRRFYRILCALHLALLLPSGLVIFWPAAPSGLDAVALLCGMGAVTAWMAGTVAAFFGFLLD